MRWLALALIVVTSGVGLAGIASAQMAPAAKETPAALPSASDDRQAVAISEATRIFILAEMRNMLSAAQGVAEATGNRDWNAVAAAAGRSGLKAFQGIPKQVMMELPEDFRGMGRQSHMAFDAVADAANAGSDPAAISAKLAETMQFCVACHQMYRFTTKP